MRKETKLPDKKPLVHIGPGLTISLVIVAALLAVRLLTPAQPEGVTPTASPIIEKSIESANQESLGPVPGIEFVLDRAHELKLSSKQEAGLVSLQAEWDKVYGPKMRAAEATAKSVGSYLGEKKGGRSAPVAQIEGKAVPFVSLSRQIAAGRRQYWANAMGLLTPKQRGKVETARKAYYENTRKALARIAAKKSEESR